MICVACAAYSKSTDVTRASTFGQPVDTILDARVLLDIARGRRARCGMQDHRAKYCGALSALGGAACAERGEHKRGQSRSKGPVAAGGLYAAARRGRRYAAALDGTRTTGRGGRSYKAGRGEMRTAVRGGGSHRPQEDCTRPVAAE